MRVLLHSVLLLYSVMMSVLLLYSVMLLHTMSKHSSMLLHTISKHLDVYNHSFLYNHYACRGSPSFRTRRFWVLDFLKSLLVCDFVCLSY